MLEGNFFRRQGFVVLDVHHTGPYKGQDERPRGTKASENAQQNKLFNTTTLRQSNHKEQVLLTSPGVYAPGSIVNMEKNINNSILILVSNGTTLSNINITQWS